MVDLTTLPTPQMLQSIDAEAMITTMATAFVAWAQDNYGVDVTGIVSLEGEPIAVQIEFQAYQRAALYASFNDVLKSNLLAFAAGADLDALAADHGVTRLTGETDAQLRSRIVLADQGSSTAGSEEWYAYQARSVSSEVDAVAVYRTGSGPEIEVAILSTAEGGVPSSALLAQVSAKVTSNAVRCVNDIVSVVSGTKTTVDVVADVWLLPDTPVAVFDGLEAVLRAALDSEGGFGFDINRAWLIAKLMVSGVSKVSITAPAVDVVMDSNSAATFGTITLAYKGRSK
ncbi:baseplate J/gp47 family protein [Agrobacterium vitis]|uniref:baseplate J/gp47 family protein n=1 Tax=Agrobacterium vitis TaxID=373 RepID=UPI0009BEEBFC|nr:baseplate J/gp47 family protein [Agrobacterium vitis]MUO69210.1 baseplate J protein [Agrobacterium vitis]